jgi:ATP-dependent DNA ligase
MDPVLPLSLQPMRLARRPEPFSDPAWLFELKYDGFRALAHLSDGNCKLISRNGNAFRSFESLRVAIPGDVRARQAVIDGEIVCLDAQGRSRFNDLLFHRAELCFVAFDLLWCAGEDLRQLPLIDRKLQLRSVVREMPSVSSTPIMLKSAGKISLPWPANMTWRESLPSTVPGRTSATARKRHGSRSGTGPIRRCRTGMSCLTEWQIGGGRRTAGVGR